MSVVGESVVGGAVMGAFVKGAGLGPVSAVSRSTNKLDVFAVGLDGRVYTAAWQPGDKTWRGWWAIDGIECAPCAPVAAVCRSVDKLDIFAVALDGGVYTAAWQAGDKAWKGWWRVGNLTVPLHAPIAAVSRSADKLDVFAAGLDGRVHTAAWQPGDKSWRGWWTIGTLKVPPGAPVSAVARSKDKLDVFVTGADGLVRTAAWEPAAKGWRGWWTIRDFKTVPRSPVSAVSRSANKLDIFAAGSDGRIYTAAWQPGDKSWRGWWPVANFIARKRTSVTAVSRSTDKLDVFAVAPDGRVFTAAWEPGDGAWRGWWPVRDLKTTTELPIGVACRSADKLDVIAPRLDGRVLAAAWQAGDKAWNGWWFVSDLVTGMTDPGVSSWKKVGVAFHSENTAHSEEAQGMTTDGVHWYLTSNNANTVRKYAGVADLVAQKKIPQGTKGGHVGAPGFFDGWLYVPIQHPWGVWKATAELASTTFIQTKDKGTDRFPWCDVNPLNGRLYTSEFDHWNNANGILFAYDKDTLERRPEDDIGLGNTPIHFDRIQGGVFTRHGRLILSRSGPNGVFCFSAATGHCFGGKKLGNFGSTGSEVEGVTVRPWQFNGTPAHVHILELDNDWSNKDDCYLHSYQVPEPARL
jgi:hypothetical protein